MLIFLAILLVNYLSTVFVFTVVDVSSEDSAGNHRFLSETTAYRIALITDICCLVVFKYAGFFLRLFNGILKIFSTGMSDDRISSLVAPLELLSPPRISYFILIIIGYITDVHWERIKPLKNPCRFALLASYFPLMTSGPIVEYDQVGTSLFNEEKNHFSYDRTIRGLMRILWGLFKKLVISERFAVIVNTIYSFYETYPGFYILVGASCFAIQLYTDFSGLMDIVLGISETLGIILPENFRTPFYSLSLAEFWRRWHITLGGWLKDYVFYAVQRTRLFTGLRKFCKKKLGRGYEKKYNIPQFLGLLISWFLIGLWHGGGLNYIFGVGLYMGIIIILSELFSPFLQKLVSWLHIRTDCFSYRLFQRIRTFFIFIFGLSFFRASSLTDGFKMWKSAFSLFNPWIFFDRSLYELGLTESEIFIALFSLLLLFIVSYFQHREETAESGLCVRDLIMKQNVVFRFLLFWCLSIATFLWGYYGTSFNAADFIYGRF
ncbi:MAG: MBOAT family protein [Lachnospiraceae bacterium]|nr:MBOAT family protein [Lachnospiraceae bacterium]